MSNRRRRQHSFGFILIVYLMGVLTGISIGFQEGFGRQMMGEATDQEVISPTQTHQNRAKTIIGKSVWDVLPLEHTKHVKAFKKQNPIVTDTYNPFFFFFDNFCKPKNEKEHPVIDFPDLPGLDSWVHYFEGYHNHFHRFRGKNVTLMEIGVQSGGKIGLLRDYFGPGFVYIGVDVNNSTKMFDSAPNWINIEIGDSENREFLSSLRAKYPHVDIFLDDGGHFMRQQTIAFEEMLPHVHQEGVFICEDLATSWVPFYGGVLDADVRNQSFVNQTMAGLVHRTIDWLNSAWIHGASDRADDDDDQVPANVDPSEEFLWRVVVKQVKHIHLYNQLVVYEKGITYRPTRVDTIGNFIPYLDSGVHDPVNWQLVLQKIKMHTQSPW